MVTGQRISEPITGISSMATRSVLDELVQDYARLSGQQAMIESVGGVIAARRIEEGDAFDIVVLASNVIERLAEAGHVVPGSRVDIVRSGVAVAVASGATRPDIGTEAALREAVLVARTIGYSTGPSGAHLQRLFERWGIAEAVAARTVQASPGVPVGALIARGEVELGFQQLSEMLHVPGIEVIGPLPDDIQIITTFSAGVCTVSERRDAATALLSFLASPQCDAAKIRHGMTPA